ncbi:MAG: DUF362 domain-containing protein [Desulfatibacillaceae bacterium]|nr:DUF362 domain-containing protein [Desulfatibacillaceae bacterium]
MAQVSLQKCDSYDPERLYKLICSSLAGIGFDVKDFSGKTVLIKPNLLVGVGPERAVTTHHEFFRAAARVVAENKGRAVVCESPAITSLSKALKKTGMAAVVEEFGLEMADENDSAVLLHEGQNQFKRFEISHAAFDADIILNLPKLKTHGITYMTGAVKNLFGLIPGLQKSRWHMKAPTPESFADFLLDFNEALHTAFEKPKTFIHLMDAVVGMEGEGPGPSGTPRHIGAILAGKDAVAVDWVAVKLLGLPIEKVRTITEGFARACFVSSQEEIEIVGQSPESFGIKDFKPSKNTFFSNMWRGPLATRTVRNLFTEKPVPQDEKCVLCYQCLKICPAHAIDKNQGKAKTPSFDHKKCIRCYCCAEICPEAAISLKKGSLQWLLPR